MLLWLVWECPCLSIISRRAVYSAAFYVVNSPCCRFREKAIFDFLLWVERQPAQPDRLGQSAAAVHPPEHRQRNPKAVGQDVRPLKDHPPDLDDFFRRLHQM